MVKIDRIDDEIRVAVGDRWTKVAMVIVRAVRTLHGRLPDGDARYNEIAQRVEALVNTGQLAARGNVKDWRHSEIRQLTKQEWLRRMKHMKHLCCFCNKDVPLGGADTFSMQISKPAELEPEQQAVAWAHGKCFRAGVPLFAGGAVGREPKLLPRKLR